MAGITHKARLVMKQPGKPFFLNDPADPDGILSPLAQDGGIVFPLTPTIMMSHSANYGTHETTGSISQQNFYMNTPNPNMSVTAMFASNTIEEAKYTAAALHFLKSCMKSDFGIQAGDRAGTPPPILKFSCYGTVHAKNVPVVLRNFTYTLPEDTDYVEVNIGNELVSVPTLVLVAAELTTQLTPKRIKDDFNIRSFASGTLLKGGNPGGFI